MLDINRVEIIDADGRSYVNYAVSNLIFCLQDGDKTLKIFIDQSGDKNQLNDDHKLSLAKTLTKHFEDSE